MTDVRDEVATATSTDQQRRSPRGDFIWYELITPDPEGSKAFYDAVVGWNIGEAVPEFNGYRMINADGGAAGGVLPLTDEMQQHGARPTWLGYVQVPDVDQAVDAINQAGGKALMDAFDIPGVGRIAMVGDPDGAPFYVMKPTPPQGRENESSDVFSPDKIGRCGWNELQTGDVEVARRFYGGQFGWGSDEFMDMGEMGLYRFWDQNGTRIGRCSMPRTASRRTGASISGCRRLRRPRKPPKPRAGRSTWGRTRSRPAITSSSAAIRKAPSSRSSAASKAHQGSVMHVQQNDHVPVVRPGRGAQRGRILCVGLS